MKLVVKFNLAFVAVFLIGFGNAAFIADHVLERNAREEVLQHARILMETAVATGSYTASQVRPLLETHMKYAFLPQSVPAYSATEVFNGLRKKLPDYTYKEAALNPTNPRDRAVDWESDIIYQFRNDPERSEIVGERGAGSGRTLYIARPIQIKDGACLVCHSTAEAAPKTMVQRYGHERGFGWKLNEVVGAQVVSVPAELPIQRANATYRTFLLSLGGVFVFIAIGLNITLYEMVIRPVSRLSRLADSVSLGHMDGPDFSVRSKDEIGVLSESLNRMKRSLAEAMKMLEQ